MSSEARSSRAIDSWLFVYGLCFAVWHIAPVFLGFEVRFKMTIGDLLDLSTPYILVGIIIKLVLLIRARGAGTGERERSFYALYLLLAVGVITFVEGHGIHLAANAIYRHIGGAPHSPVARLTYFLDEVQSHILWHSGLSLVVLSLIIIDLRTGAPGERLPKGGWLWAGGLLYGFTDFANGIEGQTVFLSLPLAILIPLALWFLKVNGRRSFTTLPVSRFFFTAFLLADVLYAVWLIITGGFPQFSELGWM